MTEAFGGYFRGFTAAARSQGEGEAVGSLWIRFQPKLRALFPDYVHRTQSQDQILLPISCDGLRNHRGKNMQVPLLRIVYHQDPAIACTVRSELTSPRKVQFVHFFDRRRLSRGRLCRTLKP